MTAIDWLEIAETRGFAWLLALFALGYIVLHFRRLEPRLQEIERVVASMDRLVQSNTNAMRAMAESTDNVAASLAMLDKTMAGQNELMRQSIESDSLTHKWMKEHDDRSEKIFTMVYAAERDRLLQQGKRPFPFGDDESR